MANLRVAFKAFDSKMASREKLFRAATEFASQIGRDRLITLTHSEDHDNIVITIWYWTDEPEGKAEVKGLAKQPGAWKRPEDKPSGPILATAAAEAGQPIARQGPAGDPVRPPAHKTMEIKRQEIPPESLGAADG